jgi:hypothetical protein
MEVRELPADNFEKATFGGDLGTNEYDSVASAYLLFYVKKDATIRVGDETVRFDAMSDLSARCDPELVQAIESSTEAFVKNQVLFSADMFEFISKMNELEVILLYFVNVFCHSGHTELCSQMEKILQNFIDDEPNQEQNLLKILTFFNRRFDAVASILVKCPVFEMLSSFCNFFIQVLELGPPEPTFVLLQQVLGLLPIALNVSWRQLSYLTKCLLPPLSARPAYLPMAINAGWYASILTIIASVFAAAKSSVVLENLDLSTLFTVLTKLIDSKPDNSVVNVLQYSQQIAHSHAHIVEYSALLTAMVNADLIDVPTFINSLPANKSDNGETRYRSVLRLLLPLNNEERIDQMVTVLCEQRMSGSRAFLTWLQRAGYEFPRTSGFVRQFPQPMLFRFLVDEDPVNGRSRCSSGRGFLWRHPPGSAERVR